MSTMMITVIGFEKYANSLNKSLFDEMLLPEGLDKETVVNDILLNAGEFEVLYSNLDFYISAIGIWSKRYLRTFEKWYNALTATYNPLENYDRIEEWTDASASVGSTSNKTDGNDSTQNTHNVSAYDSGSYSPDDQSNISSSTHAETSSNATGTTDSNHSGRTHGNIGVTTSQQMLEAEMKVAALSLYKQITDLFIQELCIAVY